MRKGLFYPLTAAAYPFGACVLLPLLIRDVGKGADAMGRGIAQGFAALFFMGFWTLCVLIASLAASRIRYGECLVPFVVNLFAIMLTALFCLLFI